MSEEKRKENSSKVVIAVIVAGVIFNSVIDNWMNGTHESAKLLPVIAEKVDNIEKNMDKELNRIESRQFTFATKEELEQLDDKVKDWRSRSELVDERLLQAINKNSDINKTTAEQLTDVQSTLREVLKSVK